MTINKILLQIAKGVAVLHKNGIMHRSINASSVLIHKEPKTNKRTYKLGD